MMQRRTFDTDTGSGIDIAAAGRRALRSIAAFEALKGVLALGASIGLIGLLHHDLHHIAEALIGHIGLDPGAHYPAALIGYADLLQHADRRLLVAAAGAYVLVRFGEAYGLWNNRPWGEWLGAVSGGVYVPFELRHWLHKPTAASALVLLANVSVVCFLAWRLWRRRRGDRET